MPRFITVIASALLVCGCVSDPALKYDPNAIKRSGIVTSVQEIENGKQFRDDTMTIPVAGVLVPIQLGSPQKEGNDFRYTVQTVEGQIIPITSKFGGFEVGECVTLFLSQTLPPKIARGGECR